MVTRTASTVTVRTGKGLGNGGSKLPVLGVRAGAQAGCGLRGTAVPCRQPGLLRHCPQPIPTAGSGNKQQQPPARGCQQCWLQHRCHPQHRTPRCRGPASERCSLSASSQHHRTPSPARRRTDGHRHLDKVQPHSVAPYLVCRALRRELLHAALQRGSRAAGCTRCALQPCPTATRPAAQPRHGPAAITQHSHRGLEAAACTETGCGSSTQGCLHRALRPKGP